MIEYRQTLLVLLLMMLSGVIIVQNNTNSPYTRHGYGQLADQDSGNSKVMGGAAYGLWDKYQVNFANPASYTAIDPLTFILDGGISLQNTNLSSGTVKQNAKSSNFNYITMQSRLSKWAAMSLGLLPYSSVGYSVTEYREDLGHPSQPSALQYYGDGGLYQLYLGAGFKILRDLSTGANISYLWGDITRTRAMISPGNSSTLPLTTVTGTSIQGYKLDIGAQYTQAFGKRHEAILGVVFSLGYDLGNDSNVQGQLGDSNTGVTINSRNTVTTFGSPMSLGVGSSHAYDNRLTIGAGFTFQKRSSATYMNTKNAFCNRMKIALGAEFLPNPTGRSYLAHMKYRLGAYHSQSYYKIDGARAVDEYGVTAGFGLPIPCTCSVLSLSAQHVRTKGKTTAFLNGNTLHVCIRVTFDECWSFKRKVDQCPDDEDRQYNS